jgi:hypothetical protein
VRATWQCRAQDRSRRRFPELSRSGGKTGRKPVRKTYRGRSAPGILDHLRELHPAHVMRAVGALLQARFTPRRTGNRSGKAPRPTTSRHLRHRVVHRPPAERPRIRLGQSDWD